MGIVNVTPDSFSGDGCLDPGDAIARGLAAAEGGADIVDVGGESTRPGAAPIDAAEEMRRVLPVITGLRDRMNLPISVDTYRAEVADAALAAGASIVNDVWGFRRDPDLANTVARHGSCAVAMHNRSAVAARDQTVGGYFPEVAYGDLLAEVANGLEESVALLIEAGVQPNRIIVDPGIGFGKTPPQNLVLLARLRELGRLGLPILIGPSRKSFIGAVLNLPLTERLEGTAAAVAFGILQGADIVRVHDVAEMARVARMADAVVRGSRREPGGIEGG
jgi:dihydropteroate synthase